MKHLYIIGGPMGVGKTSVCRRIEKDLPDSVFLDGDWCWDADPFQITDETKAMVLDNIVYLLNNFIHCTAYRNIIFCWVMHRQDIIDAITSKIDLSSCELRNISLLADSKTLTDRIMKDVKKGSRTIDVLDRSIQRIPLYESLNTIKIDTVQKSIKDIAEEIERLS